MKTEMVPLAKICLDGSTQARASNSQERIDQYAAAMIDAKEGLSNDVFPPVDLVFDGETYWPGDGIHRCFGAIKAGLAEIEAMVRPGTKLDAIAIAVGANSQHGLNRTPADKERAVRLAREVFPAVGVARIAEMCRVSWALANKICEESVKDGQPLAREVTVTKKDGSTYTMKPHRPSAPPEEEPDTPPTTADEMKDAVGQVIPATLRDIFGDRMLSEEARHLRRLASQIKSASNQFPFVLVKASVEPLNTLAEVLEYGIPYAVHRKCGGKGCQECLTVGYVPQWRFEELRLHGRW
jgi:hypothetical protein